MPNAILIAGNASRFSESVYDFRTYLVKEGVITRRRVRILPTAYVNEGIFEYRTSSAIQAKTKEPLLILFCGHGNDFGWALDDVRRFPYYRLAEMLLVGKRPVTIVSDCCHAMAAVKQFETRNVSQKRISFIAATEADETTSGGLTEIAMNSWRQNRPIRFSSELRWGTKFDSHYYPKVR